MRVAVFHDLPSGGAKRALYEVARRLRARGHALELYGFASNAEDFLDVRSLCETVTRVPLALARRPPRLPFTGLPLDLLNYARLRSACGRIARRIDAGRADAVLVCHCRFAHTPPLLAQLARPTLYCAQEPLRRFVEPALREASPSSPGGRVLARFLVRRERTLIRRATRVVANSAYSRHRFQDLYDIDAVVAYPGVDAAAFSPGPPHREPIVLSVGALHRSKGHDFVIAAAGAIPASHRPAVVIVADRAVGMEARRLHAIAAEHEVRLTVRERIPDGELLAWYQRVAVVACGQIGEPFGIVALEAMATATPVVAVNDGGLRETVVDGVTGYLVPRDRARFADRLAAVVNEGPLRAALGKGGREWVQARWTWERTTDVVEARLGDLRG